MNYAYTYKLSDNSSGTWITIIKPDQAAIELKKRFVGRRVVKCECINKKVGK